MSWGDCWGDTPCRNALVLAKAFYEGRERSFGKSRVAFNGDHDLCYHYEGSVIAWYTPDSGVARRVAQRLTTGALVAEERTPLEFRSSYQDRGEARHLIALGIDAKWQYGGQPFLIEGADADLRDHDWATKEEWQARPKWVEVQKPVISRPERFVNLTMPLFA